MKKIDDDFNLVNLPEEAKDPEITAEDFTLQQADGSIHEQKFQTKPTTFIKDSLKRFGKNKSSVVASYILGALILLAIFVPVFNKNDVSKAANSAYSNLQPKLFDSGAGWWDGTKHVSNCPVDPYNNNMPDPELYLEGGVTNKVVEGEKYTNISNKYGYDGYVQVGYYGVSGLTTGYLSSSSPEDMPADDYFVLDLDEVTLTITDFNVVDLDKLNAQEAAKGRKGNNTLPENFDLGKISVEFVYVTSEEELPVTIIEPAVVHNIGLDPAKYEHTESVVINDIIKDAFDGRFMYDNFYFRFKIVRDEETPAEYENVCSLVSNFKIVPTYNDENYPSKEKVDKYFTTETTKKGISGISFLDAMQFIYRAKSVGSGTSTQVNYGFWSVTNETKLVKKAYLGRTVFASFDYDSYMATLGPRMWTVTSAEFEHYRAKGWMRFDVTIQKKSGVWVITHFEAPVIVNKDRCPVLVAFTQEDVVVDQQPAGGNPVWSAEVKVLFYKYLDETATSMPKFLFGTDKSGRDMFKYVFEGLRNSLALGVVTFLVCFTFGLIWGAVSGYFGGAVDLVMERFTDILSGIPWIVVMTLIILKAGESSFGVFALALCMTGWIGTASTTRTQFYRFRGREYVLASRTLGASDARLIAKHILPNALGTIITGAVLMIPSVIFSEATISYLGLGFKNLSSLGVILSNNQAELTNHPYQLIFPSVVIALVMISFNLFGNGLRDAINPSLKGEDE